MRGHISLPTAELDDLIVAAPMGSPTYNFLVIIDDWDMEIPLLAGSGRGSRQQHAARINIYKALIIGAGICPRHYHDPGG